MGEIIQFVPRPNPNRAKPDERTLEQQALDIMTYALMGEPGMIGMDPVIYIEMPEGKEPA